MTIYMVALLLVTVSVNMYGAQYKTSSFEKIARLIEEGDEAQIRYYIPHIQKMTPEERLALGALNRKVMNSVYDTVGFESYRSYHGALGVTEGVPSALLFAGGISCIVLGSSALVAMTPSYLGLSWVPSYLGLGWLNSSVLQPFTGWMALPFVAWGFGVTFVGLQGLQRAVDNIKRAWWPSPEDVASRKLAASRVIGEALVQTEKGIAAVVPVR